MSSQRFFSKTSGSVRFSSKQNLWNCASSRFDWVTSVFVSMIAIGLSGCGSTSSKSDSSKLPLSDISKAAQRPHEPGKIFEEVSLKSDRAKMDELRAAIPESQRKENDELSGIDEFFAGGEQEPNRVREKFEHALRSKREKMNGILRKKREDFANLEKKTRDEHLKKSTAARNDMVKGKLSADERKEFASEQEQIRAQHFGEERDRRKAFESEITDQRHTFEDYAREKRGQFDQRWREYRISFEERKKALKLKADMFSQQMRIGPGGRPTGAALRKIENGIRGQAGSLIGSSSEAAAAPSGAIGNAGGETTAPTPDPDFEAFKNIPPGPGTKLGTDPTSK
jgi:hypothetical protein